MSYKLSLFFQLAYHCKEFLDGILTNMHPMEQLEVGGPRPEVILLCLQCSWKQNSNVSERSDSSISHPIIMSPVEQRV